jgi:hypothetical protein
MEDLERYLNDVVDPTIRDFEQHPTSVRHAFIACVVTYHGVDYLAHPRKWSADLRQKFRRESLDFDLVDDVAHAFKHVVVKRQDPNVKAAAEVISRPPFIWGEAVWDLSRWDDAIGGVTLVGARNIDLLDVVKRAAAYLRSKTST